MRKKKNNSVVKKLVGLGQSQYLCLPAPYLRMMGVDSGDRVAVSFVQGKIVVERAFKRRGS